MTNERLNKGAIDTTETHLGIRRRGRIEIIDAVDEAVTDVVLASPSASFAVVEAEPRMLVWEQDGRLCGYDLDEGRYRWIRTKGVEEATHVQTALASADTPLVAVAKLTEKETPLQLIDALTGVVATTLAGVDEVVGCKAHPDIYVRIRRAEAGVELADIETHEERWSVSLKARRAWLTRENVLVEEEGKLTALSLDGEVQWALDLDDRQTVLDVRASDDKGVIALVSLNAEDPEGASTYVVWSIDDSGQRDEVGQPEGAPIALVGAGSLLLSDGSVVELDSDEARSFVQPEEAIRPAYVQHAAPAPDETIPEWLVSPEVTDVLSQAHDVAAPSVDSFANAHAESPLPELAAQLRTLAGDSVAVGLGADDVHRLTNFLGAAASVPILYLFAIRSAHLLHGWGLDPDRVDEHQRFAAKHGVPDGLVTFGRHGLVMLCAYVPDDGEPTLYEFATDTAISEGPMSVEHWLSRQTCQVRADVEQRWIDGLAVVGDRLRAEREGVEPAPSRLVFLEDLVEQVHHKKFGVGEVLERQGDGPKAKIRVEFDDGERVLLARFVTPYPG